MCPGRNNRKNIPADRKDGSNRDGDRRVSEWQMTNKIAIIMHHIPIHISLGRSSKYCNYMYTGVVYLLTYSMVQSSS